jgi:hypothetical protein
MHKRITLLKNNDKKDWTDLEWIDEFYNFLQGERPESLSREFKPKLNRNQAFRIIWYLQEHFPLLPDTIEKCWSCGGLFDSASEGIYWETKGRHYCGGCDHLVPENYDRGKR